MSNELSPLQGRFILFYDKVRQMKLKCHFEKDRLWLTQIVALYQKIVSTISQYLGNIDQKGEVEQNISIQNDRIVCQKSNLQVSSHAVTVIKN